MGNNPIYVTRPSLPPLADLIPYLEEIWSTGVLTNHGPFHERFQRELQRVLAVPHVSLVTNGMLALEIALESVGLTGEVITTPYSFVATAHAIRRNGLTPVFVDVGQDLNIDPELIEAAITEGTSAIVAVHCYGNPCAVDELADIARRHDLKLIYDAAHAFGVTINGQSLLGFGDFATLSFHATKAFNTFEGGAIVAKTADGQSSVDRLRNFGILDEVTVAAAGTNAKMSEFNAALGLLQITRMEEVRSARARVDSNYRSALSAMHGVQCLPVAEGVQSNFSYFPILVGEGYGLPRDGLYDALKQAGIYSRRYFYPLLSNLPMYRELPSAAAENLSLANRAANQILCLPIYPSLAEEDQQRIIEVIQRHA